MNLGIILLILQFVSMTDGQIIINCTGGDSQRPVLKLDCESGNLEREIKEALVSVNQQIGDLKTQVEELQNSVEGRTRKCPDAWFPYNDSCFYFDSIHVNFTTAESFCKGHNAHLVHLETREKYAYFQRLMTEVYKDRTGYHVWIGMTDVAKEGVWKMTGTDKIVPFFDWGPGEPQNHLDYDPTGQDCAVVYRSGTFFKWADFSCNNRTAFVACEKTKQN